MVPRAAHSSLTIVGVVRGPDGTHLAWPLDGTHVAMSKDRASGARQRRVSIDTVTCVCSHTRGFNVIVSYGTHCVNRYTVSRCGIASYVPYCKVQPILRQAHVTSKYHTVSSHAAITSSGTMCYDHSFRKAPSLPYNRVDPLPR